MKPRIRTRKQIEKVLSELSFTYETDKAEFKLPVSGYVEGARYALKWVLREK